MDDGWLGHNTSGNAFRKRTRSDAWISAVGKFYQKIQKMCTPRYLDIRSNDISTLTDDDGTHIRVIAGDYRGYKGLVDGIDTDPSYFRYYPDTQREKEVSL